MPAGYGPVLYVGGVTSNGVHLRRTEENAEEIAGLADRYGATVGLAGVLRKLNRAGVRTPVPGLAVDWGFRWADDDVRSARWWPQGVTNSAHVPGVEHPVLVASWYAKDLPGDRDNHGSRISVVNLTTLEYRHVLLVVPEPDGDRVRMRPLAVHAGGLVWGGPYLHVAGTRRGLFSCRMEDVIEVEPGEESFGHRFVLPVRFAYDATSDDEQMRYSFLSLDRTTSVPHLVAGEYARGDAMTRRIARYPLDPATFHLHAEEDGVSRPVSFDERGVGHMQGVSIVEGQYYVTASRGRWRLGAVHVGQPGAFRTRRRAVPVGPEDLCYWGEQDRFWSLTEYPGRRVVFCMQRSTLTDNLD